jgi:hypothetical protein
VVPALRHSEIVAINHSEMMAFNTRVCMDNKEIVEWRCKILALVPTKVGIPLMNHLGMAVYKV